MSDALGVAMIEKAYFGARGGGKSRECPMSLQEIALTRARIGPDGLFDCPHCHRVGLKPFAPHSGTFNARSNGNRTELIPRHIKGN